MQNNAQENDDFIFMRVYIFYDFRVSNEGLNLKGLVSRAY